MKIVYQKCLQLARPSHQGSTRGDIQHPDMTHQAGGVAHVIVAYGIAATRARLLYLLQQIQSEKLVQIFGDH